MSNIYLQFARIVYKSFSGPAKPIYWIHSDDIKRVCGPVRTGHLASNQEVGGSNPLFHPRKNILKNLEIFFGVPKFSLSLQPLSEEKENGEREKAH